MPISLHLRFIHIFIFWHQGGFLSCYETSNFLQCKVSTPSTKIRLGIKSDYRTCACLDTSRLATLAETSTRPTKEQKAPHSRTVAESPAEPLGRSLAIPVGEILVCILFVIFKMIAFYTRVLPPPRIRGFFIFVTVKIIFVKAQGECISYPIKIIHIYLKSVLPCMLCLPLFFATLKSPSRKEVSICRREK